MTKQNNNKRKCKMTYKEREAEKKNKQKSVSALKQAKKPEFEFLTPEDLAYIRTKLKESGFGYMDSFRYCWFCRSDVFAISSNSRLECPNCTNTLG